MVKAETKDGLDALYSVLVARVWGEAPLPAFTNIKENELVLLGVHQVNNHIHLEWLLVREGIDKLPEGVITDISANGNGVVSLEVKGHRGSYLHVDAATKAGYHWFEYNILAFGAERLKWCDLKSKYTVVRCLHSGSITV